MDKMKSLKNIKRDNEAIITFITTAYCYNSFELLYDTDLVEDIHKADLGNILEYTLSRMIEEEFTEEEIFSSSGMYIPSKLSDLEEEEEVFIYIDLGHVIKRLIVSIKEEK